MRAEVPGAPPLFCPNHMGSTSILPGVVQPSPVPRGEIATIDLEISDRPLSTDLYAVTLTNWRSATVVRVCGISQGECIEIGFELRYCGCIVPFFYRPEGFDAGLQFEWSINEEGH